MHQPCVMWALFFQTPVSVLQFHSCPLKWAIKRKLHRCCLFIFLLLINKSTGSGAWFLEGHTYLKSWSHPTRVAGWPGSPTWGQAVAYSSLGAFWCYMAITPAAVPWAGFVADGQPSRSVATLLAPAVYPLRNSEEETTKKKTKKTSKRGKGNAN